MGLAERVSRREVVRKSDAAQEAMEQTRLTLQHFEQRIADIRKTADHNFNEARATSQALEAFQQRTFWERVRWLTIGR